MEHDESIRTTVHIATSVAGRLAFGDRGLGGVPLDGDVILSGRGALPWRGTLSADALAAAERVWSGRRGADRSSRDTMVACARAALDCDAAFFGLEVEWGSARVEVVASGREVEVTALVRPAAAAPVPGTLRRASVRMELVDGTTNEVEFVLSDGAESEVFDRETLRPEELAGARWLDGFAAIALGLLDRVLDERRLPSRTHWRLDYSEAPAWESTSGTCGELEVWTTFTLPSPSPATTTTVPAEA